MRVIVGKLEGLLCRELDKLSSRDQKRSLYCWRKYLSGLGGFKTIDRNTLLHNLKFFADGFVVLNNPLARSTNLYTPWFRREDFMVAEETFALKRLAIGLPDISSMKFKMPKDWRPEGQNPDLRFDFSKDRISVSREKQTSLFE